MDDHCRFTWVFLLQLKIEVIVAITNYLLLIKNQFGLMVKTIRSDNGTELFNSQCTKLFQNLGIAHQSRCVHTPQQNDIVKRKHRHILDMAKALRFQAKIPIRYWGLCTSCSLSVEQAAF